MADDDFTIPITDDTCSFCADHYVIEVNGLRGCERHIDNAISGGMMAVRGFRELLETSDQEGTVADR